LIVSFRAGFGGFGALLASEAREIGPAEVDGGGGSALVGVEVDDRGVLSSSSISTE
jgi:hypothetical protein